MGIRGEKYPVSHIVATSGSRSAHRSDAAPTGLTISSALGEPTAGSVGYRMPPLRGLRNVSTSFFPHGWLAVGQMMPPAMRAFGSPPSSLLPSASSFILHRSANPVLTPVKFGFALSVVNSLELFNGSVRSHFSGRGRGHLNGKHNKVWLLAAMLIVVLCGAVPWLVIRAEPAAQDATLTDAARNKILTYIRERFGVPDTDKLALGEPHTSTAAPGFNEVMVTVGDGKNQHTQVMLASKDLRYLIIVPGSIIDLHQNSAAEMEQSIREAFKTPANIKLSVGGFKHSPAPDFDVGNLSIDDGKTKQNRPVLLTRDGKHLILSEMFNMTVDPRAQALHTISLQDEPSQGPADAPVTIVEFADLQCPTCARMQDFIETTLLPRYGNKLRVVYKEFPLPVHDWSFTAAIANQCAYEINPASYVPLRTAIFRNQQLINLTNLRESLLSYGEQAGLDRVKLAGCLDAKSTLPRIQRDMKEAKAIEVDRTPTLFVNGRMIIGLPSEEAYFQMIDGILRGGK